MAGLVGYASSDEESDQEEVQQSPPATNGAHSEVAESKPSQLSEAPRVDANGPKEAEETKPAQPERAPNIQPAPGPSPGSATRPAPGPSLPSLPSQPPAQNVVIGPSRPAAADMAALPSLDDDEDAAMADAADNNPDDDDKEREPPLSPYSAERAAVRQLTMPRVPDFDIPGGDDEYDGHDEDDASSVALNKKFATFLELKQKKNTHFNARLAQSDAMKNPALMDKLMAFVGLQGASVADDDAKGAVDTEAAAAPYGTTLPAAIWDPAAFPAEAYRRSLRRLQEDAAKQRARAPGEPVSFVSATAETPAAAGPGKRKSRFD